MLRNAFLAFIAGWITWFWIEKPRHGLDKFLKPDDSMLVNFQRAFDLLKSGYLEQSFIYIWNAHYIVLSLLGGAALTLLIRVVSEMLSRRRITSNFNLPATGRGERQSPSATGNKQPESET